MQESRSFSGRIVWFQCFNVSGEVIPSFAIMYPTEADAGGIISVDQHTTSSAKLYLFNGPCQIPVGGYGQCHLSFPAAVLHTGTAPGNNVRCGTLANDWGVSTTATGLLGIGGVVGGQVWVVPEICVP